MIGIAELRKQFEAEKKAKYDHKLRVELENEERHQKIQELRRQIRDRKLDFRYKKEKEKQISDALHREEQLERRTQVENVR